MKIELSTQEAVNILLKDWSYNAALALVEYYESLEEELGESIDLDRVAIRCDWSEYESAVEAAKDYSELSDSEQAALAYFRDRTNVITFEGGLLIQKF
jgi:hypothetical protein